MGLRGREEDADLVEAVALRERVLEPALVRDQDGEGDALGPLDRGEHLGAVGELRDHVGADERGHLDPLQARVDEHPDQPDLLGRRDHLGLVLEAVSRADLADPDLGREAAHRLDHPEAAGDAERLAGHVRALLGGEEGDRGGDLVRLAEAAQLGGSAIVSTIRSPISPSSTARCSSGVSIGPGAIALAVIP